MVFNISILYNFAHQGSSGTKGELIIVSGLHIVMNGLRTPKKHSFNDISNFWAWADKLGFPSFGCFFYKKNFGFQPNPNISQM